MSSIKGQPSPKPQSLAAPVPADDAMAAFQSTADEMFKPDAKALEAFNAAAGETQAEPFADTLGGKVVGKVAEFLPTAGSIVGGIAGGIAGAPAAGVGAVPGSIAGAALGGAAGTAYRDIIETQILGRKQKSGEEVAMDIGKSAVVEGASQAIGGAVMKGLGFVGGKVLQYSDDAIRAMKGAVTTAKEAVEEPLTKMIVQKATALTPAQSGDMAKQLLVGNINGKYGKFISAYGQLDEVGKALPIKDEARRSFTQSVREWAANNFSSKGDQYKAVMKFVDEIDAADNGMKLRNAISNIGDAQSVASKANAPQLANTLKMLKQKANDFTEEGLTDLAKRISKGTASMEEMAVFEKMMQMQANPSVAVGQQNLGAYTKSVAKDYLESAAKVKKDYAGFRSFLEDVAEQTKVKVSNKGPMSFMDDLKEVPSEKLIERMFDPKNSAALKQMQKETPEVFEEVSKARVRQLVEKASPTGELDLVQFQKQVMKLPPDTRKLLFTPQEVATLNKTALSPKLQRLSSLEKKLDSKFMGYMQDVATIVGEKTPQMVKAPLRQAIGAVPARGVVGTAEALLPQQQEAPMTPLPRTVNGLGE